MLFCRRRQNIQRRYSPQHYFVLDTIDTILFQIPEETPILEEVQNVDLDSPRHSSADSPDIFGLSKMSVQDIRLLAQG
jgi:hypothetical protein